MESTLTALEKSFLHDTLEHMKGCKGKSCILPRKNHQQIGQESEDLPNNINAIPYRPPKRRHGKFLIFFKINNFLKLIGNIHTVENDTADQHSPRRRQNK
jgi:hypothetical protein